MKWKILDLFQNKTILQPIITAFIPSTLGIIYSIPICQNWISNNLGSKYWIIITVVITLIIPVLVNYLYEKFIKKFNVEKVELQRLIMCGLDEVVASKRKRFKDATESTNLDLRNIFTHITKPEDQMTILTSSLTNIIQSITKTERIKAKLILCNQYGLDRFICFCGDEATNITIDDLNTHSSLASHVFHINHEVALNIAEDSPHVPFYRPQYCKIKSILCYPISIGANVQMILSFTSEKENVFCPILEVLKLAINEYIDRFLLEYHLLVLLKLNERNLYENQNCEK